MSGSNWAAGQADRSMIRYPTDWLLAVIDEPSAAGAAADALLAAGFAKDAVKVLTGATAEWLAGGPAHQPGGRRPASFAWSSS